MLENSKHIKIPKSVNSEDDLDFAFLRTKGIEYIESMGGGLWTDMNVHDPGITFLETICYAITDLSNRINLPIESLVASKEDPNLQNQFYQAHEILPSSPITALDYRKLFTDIPGVRNSWIVPYEKTLHVDVAQSVIAYSSSKFVNPSTPLQREIPLRGLNRIIVDYDLTAKKPDNSTVSIDWINEEIFKLYHANRNLCEDLVDIIPVKEHPIGVCATIELDQDVDEDYIHAQVLFAIQNYFTPAIQHHSLKEMLDKGYTTNEIYEGPLLQNGFIDNDELKATNLRSEVRLSDLIKIIMAIDGVKLIQDISIKDCKQNKDGLGWVICIDPYTKPILCPTEKPALNPENSCCTLSSYSYYKNVLPITINKKNVIQFTHEMHDSIAQKKAQASLNRTLTLKKGQIFDAKETTTIQNALPETYGISPFGLPPNASTKRKSQALQLKGYLTFFDQILVSYFAHLAKVKDLLSINTGIVPTYFTQAIKDIKDFDKIVNDYPTDNDVSLTKKLLDSLDQNIERRNKILDHLSARFAENFSEYTFLMRDLFGKVSDEMVLYSKEQFLKDYVEISVTRGRAFDILGDTWNSTNVSGSEKRIARLSGIFDYSRRNLSNPLVDVTKILSGKYQWNILKEPSTIVLTSTEEFQTSSAATKKMYACVLLLVNTNIEKLKDAFAHGVAHETQIENILIKERFDGNYEFNVIEPTDASDPPYTIVGLHPVAYETFHELEVGIIQVINYLKSGFNEEGIFLIEHMLMLPDISNEDTALDLFLPICIENESECCAMDPYSFKVSVVLPGYTQRYSDPDFRNYMELLIQKELPAHIVPRICWIGQRKDQEEAGELNELVTLEQAYHAFLTEVKNVKQAQNDMPENVLKDFKSILFDLHSIHPTGRLHDCESDEDLEGKIILGRTNLGTL